MTGFESCILNKDNQPKVSILMNCYNGEKYLREAIESIFAQNYQNQEIIFWDNQLTDNSVEIIKSYVDQRLKYYYVPKHTILLEARKYALENVHGDFISFLEADDWWLPEKLESQVVLFSDPDVGVVCSNYFMENQIEGRRWLMFKKLMPQDMVLDDLLRHYSVALLHLAVGRTTLSYSFTPFDSRYDIDTLPLVEKGDVVFYLKLPTH